MNRRHLLLAMSSSLLAPAVRVAAAADPIGGRYLAEDREHAIQLYFKKQLLFGRIIWTKNPNLKDKNNPNPKLRQRPLVGIEHIRSFQRADDGAFRAGTLYNPEDGETYRATIQLLEDDRLRIEGQPRVPVVGALLGALFGRIYYTRWVARHDR